jgi:hypothetical protein
MTTEEDVVAAVQKLERRNREWGLNIRIQWSLADGWQATVEAARQMSEAYDVVYATENGARRSNHYDGTAVDIAATGLPRKLRLTAPDGADATFDLSDPEQTRDLCLTPELISWVEEHYQLIKLKGDYPHWDDAAPPKAGPPQNVEAPAQNGAPEATPAPEPSPAEPAPEPKAESPAPG